MQRLRSWTDLELGGLVRPHSAPPAPWPATRCDPSRTSSSVTHSPPMLPCCAAIEEVSVICCCCSTAARQRSQQGVGEFKIVSVNGPRRHGGSYGCKTVSDTQSLLLPVSRPRDLRCRAQKRAESCPCLSSFSVEVYSAACRPGHAGAAAADHLKLCVSIACQANNKNNKMSMITRHTSGMRSSDLNMSHQPASASLSAQTSQPAAIV